GLARAVLTDDRVHGALADGDVDVVVGDDAGETFGDPAEFYCGRTAGRVDGALSSKKESRRWWGHLPAAAGG
ncbi:hypothetical protein AB4Z54_37720, partial [Streptomyces sp. MCAF7]